MSGAGFNPDTGEEITWEQYARDRTRLLVAAKRRIAQLEKAADINKVALREAFALVCMIWRCDCEGDWPADRAADLLTYFDKPHKGDCTNTPMTCLRCEAEAAYRQADALVAVVTQASGEAA